MYESSKCYERRILNGDYKKYITGDIIDIGAAPDPVKSPFGVTREWNLEHGDAQYLATLRDNSFDCVYSSHCLEHMVDVEVSLRNWVRVLKPKGFLYIVVPDYDLYEKGKWPSRYNSDHRYSFSINKTRDDVRRDNHFNVCLDIRYIFKQLHVEVKKIELEDSNFDYSRFEEDQTLGNAESQILIVAQKE